jgi:hypothetical protein
MIDLGIPEPRRLTLSIGESVVIDEYKLEITAKNLERDNYVDLELVYSERSNYDGQRHTVGDSGWRPTRYYEGLASADLLDYAKVLYRTHHYCTGEIRRDKWKNGLEIADLAGYGNFVGTSRFYEQCILDDSFDSYYEEYCDYGVVRFRVGETKHAAEYSIEVEDVDFDKVNVLITYRGSERYGPMNYEHF